MEFLDKLLGRKQKQSGNVAKERLQLVLIHDRAKLSPGVLEQMRDELVVVISKYVDVDPHGIDISLLNTAQQHRLVADIPLNNSRSRV